MKKRSQPSTVPAALALATKAALPLKDATATNCRDKCNQNGDEMRTPHRVETAKASQRRPPTREMVIRAIAESLWRENGGNALLNWLEAEAIVDRNNLNGHDAT